MTPVASPVLYGSVWMVKGNQYPAIVLGFEVDRNGRTRAKVCQLGPPRVTFTATLALFSDLVRQVHA